MSRPGAWTVYWDQTYWAAEHQSKRGLVAGGVTWRELGEKMRDAETAWDAALDATEQPARAEALQAVAQHQPEVEAKAEP